MNRKTWIVVGASALALYLLLRNGGKGTSVIKDDGSVDTKTGFDGIKAKNLAPDFYGRKLGMDVFPSFNGISETMTGKSQLANMGGKSTVGINAACRTSASANRYKIDLPKIL